MQHCTIIGCGYVGRRILDALGPIPFSGLVRSEQSGAQIRRLGGSVLISDLDTLVELPDLVLNGADVFYLAPPTPAGDSDERMRRFLIACGSTRPRRFVYLSTSGVYGDCQGAWIDEQRQPNPQTPRARRRWDAEQQLRRWAQATDTHWVVLRVGGIYAQDRLPVERIKSGLTVVCPEDAPYSNRIHANDLARVCLAAASTGIKGATYNVADGNPTTMTDYFYRVAEFLGLPKPDCVPLAEAEGCLSPAMLSYVRESKRLDISRMRRDLRIALDYPDLDTAFSPEHTTL
jgi:nucleoside-diphosphate-sugar epimerase